MPRPCSVRNSPDIKERFGKSTTALFRHRQSHLPTSLVKARKAKEVARADRLIDRVMYLCERSEGLVDSVEEILTEARQSKDTCRGVTELLADSGPASLAYHADANCNLIRSLGASGRCCRPPKVARRGQAVKT